MLTAKKSLPHWLVPTVMVLLALVYWVGAWQHLHRVNDQIHRTDQGAYLNYAREIAKTDYAYVGGRNRMPAFPFLASLVYQDGMSEEAFFNRVKHLNIILSMLSLVAIWWVSRQWLPPLEATTFALIAAFGVFVYKSAYAQAEILFYTMSFFAFLLALRVLHRPSWWLALLTGVATGVSQLTKASLLPFLILLLAWSAVGAIVDLRRSLRNGAPTPIGWRRPLAMLLLLAGFLMTVFPYIQTSKERFGHWFYNVNSTFYVWCDSFSEAKATTGAHGDRLHWPDMPAEEIPSLRKYLREHTASQIAGRTANGFVRVMKKAKHQPAAAGLLALYLVLILTISVRARSAMGRVLFDDDRWVVTGFITSHILGHLILYSFYAPIASGARLVMALFLPSLFCMIYLSTHRDLRETVLFRKGGRTIRPRNWHRGMLGVLGAVIVLVYPYWILHRYTGN